MEETDKSEEGKSVQTKDYPSQKLVLIDAAIEKMAKSDPRVLQYKEQIKQKLLDNLSRTPDHPAYAAMIHRAIAESKRKGGASEEEISDFIWQEYKDTNLAAAHSSMLKIHLIKLCKKGEIVCTIGNRYIFPVEDSDSFIKLKQGKRQKRSRRNITKHKAEKHDKSREGMNAMHSSNQNAGYNHQIKEVEDQNRSQEGTVAIFQGQNQEVNVGERHAGQPWIKVPMESDHVCEHNVSGFGHHKLAEISRANRKETEMTEERPVLLALINNQAMEEKNERRRLSDGGEGKVAEENHLMEAPLSEEIKENDKPETVRTEDVSEEIEVSVLETQVLKEHAEVIVEEKNQASDQTNEPTGDQTTEEQHYLEEPVGGATEEKDKRQTEESEDIGDAVPLREIELLEGQMGLSRLERNPGHNNTLQFTKKQVESEGDMISLLNSFLASQNFKDSIPTITLMKSMFLGLLKKTKEVQQDLETAVNFLSMLDGSNTSNPQPVMEEAATGHLLKTLSASIDLLTNKMQLMQGDQSKPLNLERALEYTGACEKLLERQKQLFNQQMDLHLNQNSIPTDVEPDYVFSDVMLDREQDEHDSQPGFHSERDNQPDGTLTKISVKSDVQHLKRPPEHKLASIESPHDKQASICDKGKETECKEQQQESLTDNGPELESAETQIQQLQQIEELQQRELTPMVPRPFASEPFPAVIDDLGVPHALLKSEVEQKLKPSSINKNNSEALAHRGSHEPGNSMEEQSQPAEHLSRQKHLRPRVQGRVLHKEDVEQSIVEQSLPLFPQQDQQQQTEGRFDVTQLQPEGPNHVLSYQPELQQPQHPRRGRPPKRKVIDMGEALPLNDQNHNHIKSYLPEQQRSKHPRIGRPPKQKVADLGESLPLNDHNHIHVQSAQPGQLRPTHPRRGRPPLNDQKHNEELRQQKRGQGRPRKHNKLEKGKCS